MVLCCFRLSGTVALPQNSVWLQAQDAARQMLVSGRVEAQDWARLSLWR